MLLLLVLIVVLCSAVPFFGLLSSEQKKTDVRPSTSTEVQIHDRSPYVEGRNRFIFVSGSHLSGTSVLERVLSAQPFSSGLDVENVEVANRSCCWSLNAQNKHKCNAPENEGVFLTREFHHYYMQRKTHCTPKPAMQWGMCAEKQHLTEADIPLLPNGPKEFRNRLFGDWSQWWNTSRPYLVEKDIPNLVKSRFFQSLFSDTETAFVMTLRHPMSSCKNFKCLSTLDRYLNTWLIANRMALSDLQKVKHYITIHNEHLVSNASIVIEQLRSFLGWPIIYYRDVTSETPYFDRSGMMDMVDYKCLKPGQTTKKMNEEEIVAAVKCSMSSYDVKKAPNAAFINAKFTRNSPNAIFQKFSKTGNSHRKLFFHGTSDQLHHNSSYVVKISRTASSEYWAKKYPAALLQNDKALSILKKYEKDLNSLCYSIYNLEPTCGFPVHAKSQENMPALQWH